MSKSSNQTKQAKLAKTSSARKKSTKAPVATVPTQPVPKSDLSKRFGFIATIVVLILFVLTGGLFSVWYFGIYNRPENVALDAIKQLITTPHLISDGVAILDIGEGTNEHIEAKLFLKSSSKSLPNSLDATLMLTLPVPERDDRLAVEVKLGSAIMSDGTIYLQVKNATESLNDALSELNIKRTELDPVMKLAYEFIEAMDNEWWRISTNDLGKNPDSNLAELLEFESCVIAALDNDYSLEFAKLYIKYPFINLSNGRSVEGAKEPSKEYIVTFNYDKLAGFLNTLPNLSLSKYLSSCYSEYISADDDIVFPSDLTAVDIAEALPEEWNLKLTITDASHRLNSIEARFKEDDMAMTIGTGFLYEEGTVSIPEKYRPISELTASAKKLYQNLLLQTIRSETDKAITSLKSYN